jgi:hypothetical protein
MRSKLRAVLNAVVGVRVATEQNYLGKGRTAND